MCGVWIQKVVDPNNGPGTHVESRNFGYDTKKVIIQEKREERIPLTVGPGEYKTELASS